MDNQSAKTSLKSHSSWCHPETGERLEIMLETQLHHYYPVQLLNPLSTTSQNHVPQQDCYLETFLLEKLSASPIISC
jgi:hypothetical protein